MYWWSHRCFCFCACRRDTPIGFIEPVWCKNQSFTSDPYQISEEKSHSFLGEGRLRCDETTRHDYCSNGGCYLVPSLPDRADEAGDARFRRLTTKLRITCRHRFIESSL